MDFTLSMYGSLMDSIVEEEYYTPRMSEFIEKKLWLTGEYNCVLRHDVDRKLRNALRIAELEARKGVVSTYYVRYVPGVYKVDVLKDIESMGHEIGFHYECMDKAKGDVGEAMDIFERELEDMRKDFDIKTICMHGRPFGSWRNKDMWDKYDYADFGLLGEPYIDIDYSQVAYFTDTGRQWNSTTSVKDYVESGDLASSMGLQPASTGELIGVVRSGDLTKIVILAHPNRWTDSRLEWMWELGWQRTKNIGKIFLKRKS